ncbi:DUF1203 domain-containing protein [Azospirillum sp. TSO35-2]|uniref:DUF1203 domain-containing protein n=1 Tax=Azospirillum sp. TSO35-2 TaxID=716796 RepID=UPI000D61CF0F|nr:DUF1203 domain-containing protein [Azospirillum sp. TSO35-2]PWC36473.1 hypothetical protein TSO352_15400 [Azospirillum sp. TSO35-2]
MSFRVTGLSAKPFRHLYGLSDIELRKAGVIRYVVGDDGHFPDRVELRDAAPGEAVLLLNYTHQPANTPYQSNYAIFVRDGAHDTYDRVGEIPEAFRSRPMSLRAFDRDHLLVDAELANGHEMEGTIVRLFANDRVAYIHAHFAKPGCYAGRIDRV